MRIYFIGNSFTFFNDLPAMVAAELDCEVGRNLRGGAYLHQRLDETDELHAPLLADLQQPWNYVVLQDQSRGPYEQPEAYQHAVAELCRMARAAGAKPIIYETWAYRAGSEKLASTGLEYDAMQSALTAACRTAADANGALLAEVGQAFHQVTENLYCDDDYHPNPLGTALACEVICRVIRADQH